MPGHGLPVSMGCGPGRFRAEACLGQGWSWGQRGGRREQDLQPSWHAREDLGGFPVGEDSFHHAAPRKAGEEGAASLL